MAFSGSVKCIKPWGALEAGVPRKMEPIFFPLEIYNTVGVDCACPNQQHLSRLDFAGFGVEKVGLQQQQQQQGAP
ncbi:endothiapepsin [Anopheles sinensis]|uniref:Endothiapepsin n=1 Tax=Anopheles sinensis TaxID=74873 RepID=A0A084WU73_ANOSI|nr:endothiapepsin [Anopheles sinensis]